MSTSLLRMQHSSLEHTDTPNQQRQDIHDLFALGKDFPIKTGTEAGVDRAGENKNRPLLEEFADKFDHQIHFKGDNWVAVDREIIVPGSLKRDHVFVMENDKLVGRMHDRVFPTMSWDHVDPNIGRLSVGATHYATKGATPGSPNYSANVLYAAKISHWMKDVAAGRGLAFANGDFNINDRTLDWAFGRSFTSMADELKAWENTGHGPIDGFCSYDRDRRVRPQRFNVLSDKEFPQFSDHFVCRGVWEILSAKR